MLQRSFVVAAVLVALLATSASASQVRTDNKRVHILVLVKVVKVSSTVSRSVASTCCMALFARSTFVTSTKHCLRLKVVYIRITAPTPFLSAAGFQPA